MEEKKKDAEAPESQGQGQSQSQATGLKAALVSRRQMDKSQPTRYIARLLEHKKKVEALVEQRQLTAAELETCAGNEKLCARLMAQKALGYRDLMESVTTLRQDIETEKRLHMRRTLRGPIKDLLLPQRKTNKNASVASLPDTQKETQHRQQYNPVFKLGVLGALADNEAMGSKIHKRTASAYDDTHSPPNAKEQTRRPREKELNGGHKPINRLAQTLYNPFFPSLVVHYKRAQQCLAGFEEGQAATHSSPRKGRAHIKKRRAKPREIKNPPPGTMLVYARKQKRTHAPSLPLLIHQKNRRTASQPRQSLGAFDLPSLALSSYQALS